VTCVGFLITFLAQGRLEEISGCRVGLVMRNAVEQQVRDTIFVEAVRVA